MSRVHHEHFLPDSKGLVYAVGPTVALVPLTPAANTVTPPPSPSPTISAANSMSTPYQPALSDQFRAKVDDYMAKTRVDFTYAWNACKTLERPLWDAWEAQTKAANEAGVKVPKDLAQIRSECTVEFNRQVQEKMQSAGVNYGQAWSEVQQTNPRCYMRMMGDMAADDKLAAAGWSEPTIRKS